ncbi:MAG: hypothetical protein IJ048_07710 [Clostridia bacterium]|nr:hypothetical protein [Clostridia bacterium]
MKKIIAAILVCMLFASSAYAAEWPAGRSAAKPYEGTAEIDLTTTMGYILLYPRLNVMAAEHFCDTLTLYLPREDVKLATGKLHLYSGRNEIASFDFGDADHVRLHQLTETELDQLMWGSGVCIEVFLDTSLKIGENYYVLMDEGCFTTTDGTLKSLQITNPEAWRPVVAGDYGVSNLYYAKAPAEGGAQNAAPSYVIHPMAGDVITFELLMGGDAKYAVIYSDNNSVDFDQPEYTESGVITGTVTSDDLKWGIVFLNEGGEPLDVVRLGN